MSAGPRAGSRRALVALVTTGLLTGLLTGCGAGHAATAGRPSNDQDVVLTARSVPRLGPVVVTHGWTLYMYPPDRDRTVTCTKAGDCETAWPPLFVTAGHRVIAGPGVRPSLLGSTPGDGGRVVTYNHWPLYYYIGDQSAGQINGQGQGFNWYVIAPDGIPNKEAFAPAANGGSGRM